jgi:hypothetical protein
MPLPAGLLEHLAAPPPQSFSRLTGIRRPAEDEPERAPRVAQDALVQYAAANGKRARLEPPSLLRLQAFVKVRGLDHALYETLIITKVVFSRAKRACLHRALGDGPARRYPGGRALEFHRSHRST